MSEEREEGQWQWEKQPLWSLGSGILLQSNAPAAMFVAVCKWHLCILNEYISAADNVVDITT